MSMSHLGSVDLFPFTCSTLGFLPTISCETIWCREGTPTPAATAASCRHLRECRAVTPSLSFPNTQNHVSFQPTSQHFNIISLKAVCAQGLLCMKKTWTSAEGTDSQIASEEESEVLTLFILSSEISALADWHFSCWEKINEEKISWRKIDGDQTNH